MTKATFSSVIDPPWSQMEPIRLGQVPSGLGTADRFVKVENELGPLLRVDLYYFSECHAFEDVRTWANLVAIGCGNHLYLVSPHDRRATTLDLGTYFGHMYPLEDKLLVASAERLFCVAPNGLIEWRSEPLGVDGVLVHQTDDEIIRGSGDWDPPGAWRPFTLNLRNGERSR